MSSTARFTGLDDFNWFTKSMGRVTSEELGEAYGTCVEPIHYYVDFLRYSLEPIWLVDGRCHGNCHSRCGGQHWLFIFSFCFVLYTLFIFLPSYFSIFHSAQKIYRQIQIVWWMRQGSFRTNPSFKTIWRLAVCISCHKRSRKEKDHLVLANWAP